MPAPDMKGVQVRSQGFSLWKQKEAREGRITIEKVIEDTGLAKLTVRRFLARDGDVSGSTLGSAAVIANYLGVNLCDLVVVTEADDAGDKASEEEAVPA